MSRFIRLFSFRKSSTQKQLQQEQPQYNNSNNHNNNNNNNTQNGISNKNHNGNGNCLNIKNNNNNNPDNCFKAYTNYHNNNTNNDTTVCRVFFLDASYQDFVVPRKAYGSHLLQKVFRHLDLLEVDYFGLLFTDDRNVQKWLEGTKRISKQYFTLEGSRGDAMKFEFRVKFYSSQPSNLKEEITRYQIYLQVKQDIYQGRLQCPEDMAAELASLVLQAELGDYEATVHTTEMVSEFRFFPNQTVQMEDMILERFKKNKGMTPSLAELTYLNKAKWLQSYGADFHAVLGKDDNEYSLGLIPAGILILEQQHRIGLFYWPKITRLEFKKNKLVLDVVESDEKSVEQEHTFVFRCNSDHHCKQLWKRCIQHHTFFRLSGPTKPLQVKHSFLRTGSRFRYSGHTELQSLTSIRARKSVSFKRTPSQRFGRRQRQSKQQHQLSTQQQGTQPPQLLKQQQVLAQQQPQFLKQQQVLAQQQQQVSVQQQQQTQHGSLKKNQPNGSLKKKQQLLQPGEVPQQLHQTSNTLGRTKPIYSQNLPAPTTLTSQQQPLLSPQKKLEQLSPLDNKLIKTISPKPANLASNVVATNRVFQQQSKFMQQQPQQTINNTNPQQNSLKKPHSAQAPLSPHNQKLLQQQQQLPQQQLQQQQQQQRQKVQGRATKESNKTTTHNTQLPTVMPLSSNNSTISRKSHLINRPLSSYNTANKKANSSCNSSDVADSDTHTDRSYNGSNHENHIRKKKRNKKYTENHPSPATNYFNKYNSTTVLSDDKNNTPLKKNKNINFNTDLNQFNCASFHASLPKRKKVGYQLINNEPLTFQQLRLLQQHKQEQQSQIQKTISPSAPQSNGCQYLQTSHQPQNLQKVQQHPLKQQPPLQPQQSLQQLQQQLQQPQQQQPQIPQKFSHQQNFINGQSIPKLRQKSSNFEDLIITPPSSFQERNYRETILTPPTSKPSTNHTDPYSLLDHAQEKGMKTLTHGQPNKPNGILKKTAPLIQNGNLNWNYAQQQQQQPQQQQQHSQQQLRQLTLRQHQQPSNFKRVQSFIETPSKYPKPSNHFYSPPDQSDPTASAYVTRAAANQVIDKFRRMNQVKSAHVMSTEV